MIDIKLLILHDRRFDMSAAQLLRTADICSDYEVVYMAADALTGAQIEEAELIYGCPPPELLRFAAHLKWMHLPNAGAEPYNDLRLFVNSRIILTKSSGVYGVPIAEHTLALFLALSRNFPLYARQREERHWQRHDIALEMKGSVAAIFGLGDLGTQIALRMKALGCTVFGVRRDKFTVSPHVDELFSLNELHLVLPRADYVACCLPLTIETTAVFNEKAFSLMKPSAIFVNVGRGALTDEAALIKALRDGVIYAAGLDVTNPEPPAFNSPLWELENVILTPHSSCMSPYTDERRLQLFLDLYKLFVSGKRLYGCVDFYKGY